jgi:probable HAF family extracellular repeat protein
MTVRASTALSTSAIAVSLLLFQGGAGAVRVRYAPLDLGTLGGPNASASAINNRGQVVGWSNLANSENHAFVWWKGSMRDLGTLGGTYSAAVSINDSGDVAGLAAVAGGVRHACLWTSGGVRDLDPGQNTFSEAWSINNAGQVVGEYQAVGYNRACLWQNGSRIDLGLPFNASSQATSINDRGQIVGFYYPQTGDPCGFLWENGSWVTLGTCGPAPWARAINDRGDIAIAGRLVGTWPSFLFTNGAFQQIPLIPWSINQRGQVSGECDAPGSVPTPRHACIWDGGEIIHFGAPNTIGAGINDSSDVAGTLYGQNNARAILWAK